MNLFRKQILPLILIVFLSYFSVSLACTISPSLYLDTVQNSYDVRVSGLSDSGWSTPDMTFTEPRIAAASAKVKIRYAGKVEFIFNSKPAVLESNDKGAILKSEDALPAGNGIEIIAKAVDPKMSEVSRRHLGAKFESILIRPKFFLLLPTFQFAWLPVLLLSLLLILVSKLYDSKKYDLIPAAVAASAAGFFMGQNRLDFLPRAIWLWSFVVLFLAGILLYKNNKNLPAAESKGAPKNAALVLLVFIMLCAIYIRFDGLDFGLPGLFHPDESRKSKIIRSMVVTGDLNPHYFRHPNFLLYASAFNTWVSSIFHGKIPDPPAVVELGRSVSAVLGSASVLIMFLIGSLLFNNIAGIIAAAFLAFSPLHIVSSRYIKEDASMLFFALLCFYFAVKSLKKDCSVKYNLLSALFAGFSASSKYSGLLNIIFSLMPVYERSLIYLQNLLPRHEKLISKIRFADYRLKETIPGIILISLCIIGLFVAGFLTFTPYSISDYSTFIEDFMGETQHMERGHTVPITAMSYYWGFHLERSIFTWYQWLFAGLSFIAAGYVLMKRRMFGFLIFASVLLFYLPAEFVKAKPEPQPERYILPCIPFLALALGDFVSLVSAGKNKIIKYLVFGLTAAALFQIAHYSYLHSQSIKNDTRLQAKHWMLHNVPRNSKVIIDWQFYGPPGLDKYYKVLQLKDKNGSKLNRTLSAETLRNSGYDYFVFSSFSYGRFLMPTYRSHNLSKRFKAIFNEMTPVIVFENKDYAFGFHNPEIKIYKLK
jgi:hypothetical protein